MFIASRITLRRALISFQRIACANNLNPLQNLLIRHQTCSANQPGLRIPLAQLEKKMNLQYTCKVCGARNSQIISKVAYERGVVLSECQGCRNNHLVADNLKFFSDKSINIETILKEKGEQVQKVSIGHEVLEFLEKEKPKSNE